GRARTLGNAAVRAIARLVVARRRRRRTGVRIEVHVDLLPALRRARDRAASLAARASARAGTVRRVRAGRARVRARPRVERAARLDLLPLPARAWPRQAEGLGAEPRARDARRPAWSRHSDTVCTRDWLCLASAPPAR